MIKRFLDINAVKTILTVQVLQTIALLLLSIFTFGKFTLQSSDPFAHTLNRNDAGWYKLIVEEGYPVTDGTKAALTEKQSAWAFLPLFPMAAKAVMAITGLGFEWSAFLLNFFLSFVAMLLLFAFANALQEDKHYAKKVVMLAMLFPFCFYYVLPYTESIFLFFLILAFYAVLHNKWLVACFAFAFLPLIKVIGLVVMLPLLIFLIEELKKRQEKLSYIQLVKRNFKWAVPFAVAVISFVFYMLYQKEKTGFYNAFSIAQAGWNKSFMFPLLALFRNGGWEKQVLSVLVIGYLLIGILVAYKSRLSFTTLYFLFLLLPLTSGEVMSIPRYMGVVFPIFLVLAKQKKLPKDYLLFPALFIIQCIGMYFWLVESPFGF